MHVNAKYMTHDGDLMNNLGSFSLIFCRHGMNGMKSSAVRILLASGVTKPFSFL